VGSRHLANETSFAEIPANHEPYISALRELIEATRLETTNVAISLPITSAIVRTVTLPLMSDLEIQNAIEYDSLWSNIIQLEEKLEEYSIFWQVIRRNDADSTMELLFVASKLSEISKYVQIVTKAGLNPILVDVRCFAIRNALKAKKKQAPVLSAMVELGPNENYVLIVTDDAPFIYDLYLSDTDRILIEQGIPKGELGERFYDRLASQIRQAFRVYEAKVGAHIIDKVLLVSPIPDVFSLLTQLKTSLGEYHIELFNPVSDLLVPANLQEQIDTQRNASVFSSAIGLAMRKMDIFGYYKYVTGVNNVNLLPNRDAVKSSAKKKLMSKLALAGVAAIFTLFIILTMANQLFSSGTADPQYQKAILLEQDMKIKESILAKLNTQKMSYSQMLQTAEMFSSNQLSSYRMLGAVNGAVPGGVWLTEMNFNTPVSLTLKGEAANDQAISSLIERLQANPLIERASLATMTSMPRGLQSRNAGDSKYFEVKCIIKSERQISKSEQKMPS
jgi:type IV pilus assembly protein PilN